MMILKRCKHCWVVFACDEGTHEVDFYCPICHTKSNLELLSTEKKKEG